MADATRKRAFTDTTSRKRFGRYETLFRIAAGGMAEVYAARIIGEGGFQKVVALKRMLPTLAEDDKFVDMFLDEGRVAANISSPNVVQTLDLGRAEDDSLYLVMELVVGVPLNQLLKEVLKSGKHMNIAVTTEVIAQAAMGLHDAHEATTPMGDSLGIVHRDVSPQNILVDRSGRVRITDFGVARALQRTSHTQSGEVKGKMAYFAPEQAGAKELDRRVDVFALGIVAWECFAGQRLFRGDNPLLTMQKVLSHEVPDLREIRKSIPDGVAEAVAKALIRDRDKRWNDAREFAQALRSGLETRPTQADVAKYVQLHGGEGLAKLDSNLRSTFSTETSIDLEAERNEAQARRNLTTQELDAGQIRQYVESLPQEGKTHTEQAIVGRPSRRGNLLIGIGAVALFAIAAAGTVILMKLNDSGATSVRLEEQQTKEDLNEIAKEEPKPDLNKEATLEDGNAPANENTTQAEDKEESVAADSSKRRTNDEKRSRRKSRAKAAAIGNLVPDSNESGTSKASSEKADDSTGSKTDKPVRKSRKTRTNGEKSKSETTKNSSKETTEAGSRTKGISDSLDLL